MGVRGKLEVEVDIKSSADLFHELFGSKPHHIPSIIPDKVQACEVDQGELGKPGSVLYWNYTLDGKKIEIKELIEVIDKEKKLVRFKVIEGHALQVYKTMTSTLQISPNGEDNTVKWVMEFEKIKDDGPYPTKVMDLLIAATKDIEAHHLKA